MEFLWWAAVSSLLLLLACRIRRRNKTGTPVSGGGAWADVAEQALRYLTSGSRKPPDRIVIGTDSIRGIWVRGVETFPLAEAGIARLPEVRKLFHPEPEDGLEETCYVDNPQVQIARAMNCRMGGIYRIYDSAQRHLWVDSRGTLWVDYQSTQVELIRKRKK